MTVRRFHHVALPFPGGELALNAARHFYIEALGLRELRVPPPLGEAVLWFALGDGELHLFADPDGTAAIAGTRHHPCLQVEDLGAMRGLMEENGYEIIEADFDVSGRERFFIRDPFGNALELTQVRSR